jgi:ribonuclease R
MLQLAEKLRARRRENGSLFVERPEFEVEFGGDGRVSAVREKAVLSTHWIIEEFMLEANRAVAETLHAASLPLLWRVHEDPDELKVSSLIETLKELGVDWFPDEPVGGKDYQELFRRVKGSRLESLVSLLALRSLMRASYRRGRGKHFGLAFDFYTHFTSPIRRYPDLQNQRWLHVLVRRNGGWLNNALKEARHLATENLAEAADWEETLRLADHCSLQERRATVLERDCRDICAADWLADRVGEEWSGTIVGVVRSGLFVELRGCGMDGFVGLDELSGDWYVYDEKRNCLLGERTGKRYGLGQPVQVLLSQVDVPTGRVWLRDLRNVPAA